MRTELGSSSVRNASAGLELKLLRDALESERQETGGTREFQRERQHQCVLAQSEHHQVKL